MEWRYSLLTGAVSAIIATASHAVGPTTANPILFVTQVPVGGFTSATSTFGNHYPGIEQAPRGGDLMIRYQDGSLRYLTQEAGYGVSGLQGANAIAVREPCVHWSGQKALFSMVVGGATHQYEYKQYHWQVYEITGLGQGQTAVIRKIAGQPTNYNNVSPIYATDGRILFTSDRPITGASHHYPQKDEYESAPTVVGIYSLDEATQTLKLLEHAPSGAFSLSLDSFGRVIFTKWDHLQRDQQGDAPSTAAAYQAFTWADESANAATTTSLIGAEVFPEPRSQNDPAYSSTLSLHTFNHFFPWELNEDGTAEETLNHIGRHELGGSYSDGSFANDPNLTYYVPPSLHANQLMLFGSGGLFQLREDPTVPGDFLATFSQEFGTANGGTLLRLTGAPSINPENMVLTAVTSQSQVPQQTGYFRNPLPLSDGILVAAHTPATDYITNLGTTQAPNWSYSFRLKQLTGQNGSYAPTANMTPGIQKSLSWWSPDVLVTYNGILWELDPVEVKSRPVPTPRVETLPDIEANVFADEGVDVETFRDFLRNNSLALIVSRNVTQRDRADKHQPFNLKIPGGTSSVSAGGKVYDISYMQIFQGDALRGYGSPGSPSGRRLLARPMHETGVSQAPGAPAGAVALGLDGSMAALVPAQRALTWQTTDANGAGVVRERNWLSFQSGEIRVCGSCHGVNKLSQTGAAPPTNEPQALHDLLQQWKQQNPSGSPLPTNTPTNTPLPTPTIPAGSLPCTSGLTIDKARLRTKAAPGSLKARGQAILPTPWLGVDPDINGIRITIPGLLDITVPGGSGWTKRAGGKLWRFRDPNGLNGGVKAIDIANRSAAQTGLLSFTIQMAGLQSLPAPGALDMAIRLGTVDECAVAHWNDATAASPHCRGIVSNLMCN